MKKFLYITNHAIKDMYELTNETHWEAFFPNVTIQERWTHWLIPPPKEYRTKDATLVMELW